VLSRNLNRMPVAQKYMRCTGSPPSLRCRPRARARQRCRRAGSRLRE
jgi:hypothetical protein